MIVLTGRSCLSQFIIIRKVSITDLFDFYKIFQDSYSLEHLYGTWILRSPQNLHTKKLREILVFYTV